MASGPGADDDKHHFKTCFTLPGRMGDISNSDMNSSRCWISDIQSEKPCTMLVMTLLTQSTEGTSHSAENIEFQKANKWFEQTSKDFCKMIVLVRQ